LLLSIYSYADAKKYLDEALVARSATLKSQRYKISNREQQRAMLGEIKQDIEKWENELKNIISSNPSLNPNKNQKTRRGPKISYVGYK
jgi:hypothetical protein